MNAVESLMQTVKKSCDNDTIMYCFKDDVIAKAYNRPMIYRPWVEPSGKTISKYIPYTETDKSGEVILEKGYEENIISADSGYIYDGSKPDDPEFQNKKSGDYIRGTDESMYYTRIIMPRLINEPCVNIYYKNTNGVWIDYRKCLAVYPTLSILISSTLHEDKLKIDMNKLPKCIFMDENHIVHYIDEHDGIDNDLALPNIEVDTNDDTKFQFRPFSVENPNTPLSQRHIMEDVKVTIPENLNANNFLVWLNGAFVPTVKDNTYRNTVYIKQAMSMIDSRSVNQHIGAPVKPDSINATVRLENEYIGIDGRIHYYDEYRLDARFRFFGWRDVNISPWYKPLTTTKIPIVHNYSAVYIVNKITFPVEVNDNAHFIMLNGQILDPTEYVIDPTDKRTITLKNVERDAYGLLDSVISDLKEGGAYYANVRPLDLIKDVLIKRTYSLVNFESAVEGKTLYMKRSTACATNFPYVREITFSNINSGDLILINGTFNRYEWIHHKTIFFPLLNYTYAGEEATIKESEVQRIYFVIK